MGLQGKTPLRMFLDISYTGIYNFLIANRVSHIAGLEIEEQISLTFRHTQNSLAKPLLKEWYC